ncbi:MAG TPA: SUMF1/EgtB/PvdO family nonheme iron enzyme, partial [Polyangiaceae bacterium]|nr:SUMF1/EgtB/PvdO family nonheme iron enzyme [Polyangiaceae bacterium]
PSLALVAALGIYACHNVTERAHDRYRSPEGPSNAGGTAGETSNFAGAGASSGSTTSPGSSFGAEGDGTVSSGGSPDDPANGPAPVDGVHTGGSGGKEPLTNSTSAGEGGTPPLPSRCVPGAACQRIEDCWLGAVRCEGDRAICAPARPAPEHTRCIYGECTRDGSCIKAMPSCRNLDTPGCGALTVEGGTFRMGYSAGDPATPAGEPVTVDTFALDIHEATVARFRQFWATQSALVRDVTFPNGVHRKVETSPHEPEPNSAHYSYNWTPEPWEREDHPINRLTWATAFLFCAWDGGRLPTEAEWEYAATGREIDGLKRGRDYPWGNQLPNCTLANYLSCGSGTTVSVNSFEPWGGFYQMAGNVTEWTADSFTYVPGACWDGSPRENPVCVEEGSPFFVAKGGSYAGGDGQMRGVWRLKSQNGVGPRGVRCARDLLGNRPTVSSAAQ